MLKKGLRNTALEFIFMQNYGISIKGTKLLFLLFPDIHLTQLPLFAGFYCREQKVDFIKISFFENCGAEYIFLFINKCN